MELYTPQVRTTGGYGQPDSTRDWLHDDSALDAYTTPEAADAAARAELDGYCAMLNEDDDGTYTWRIVPVQPAYWNGFWFAIDCDGRQTDEGRVAIRKLLVS